MCSFQNWSVMALPSPQCDLAMDREVVQLRPFADQLQRFPILCTHIAVGVDPRIVHRHFGSVNGGVLLSGGEPALVDLRTEAARAVVRDEGASMI